MTVDLDHQAFLGDTAAEVQHLELAEDAYRTALNLTPDDPRVLNNLAWALRDQGGRLPEALTLVERALTLDPTSESAWDTLAELRFRNGEPQLALDAIREAVSLEPARRAFYDERRKKYREACRDCTN